MSIEEVEEALARIKIGKSCKVDKIDPEIVKWIGNEKKNDLLLHIERYERWVTCHRIGKKTSSYLNIRKETNQIVIITDLSAWQLLHLKYSEACLNKD